MAHDDYVCPACLKSGCNYQWIRNNEETSCPSCGWTPDEEELKELLEG